MQCSKPRLSETFAFEAIVSVTGPRSAEFALGRPRVNSADIGPVTGPIKSDNTDIFRVYLFSKIFFLHFLILFIIMKQHLS